MTIVTAKWNLQDYHQMIETGLLDERKVELVCGEIIEMSPEGAPHSSACSEIGEYRSTTHFTSGVISPVAFPELSIDIPQLLA